MINYFAKISKVFTNLTDKYIVRRTVRMKRLIRYKYCKMKRAAYKFLCDHVI